jgi:cytochrome b involved in lipid metabolism
MNNTKIKISVGVFILIVAGTIFFSMKSTKTEPSYDYTDKETTETTPDDVNEPVVNTTKEGKIYAMSEVASHSNEQSCWTTVNGNVYDVTSWISKHPGGAKAILSLCGKDGSAAFSGKHGGQDQPEETLQTFLIGKLN